MVIEITQDVMSLGLTLRYVTNCFYFLIRRMGKGCWWDLIESLLNIITHFQSSRNTIFSFNTMMQRIASENAVGLRRICKKSDQPKIERLINNDERLIVCRKLNGTTTW